MRPEKRHKLQLFYEILCAIEDDIVHNKVARPTHIQHNCRLSYDKMMNHVIELERRYLIYREKTSGLISSTSKGKKFVKQYNELIKLIESVGRI
jgi:predicted transcriptional regulator